MNSPNIKTKLLICHPNAGFRKALSEEIQQLNNQIIVTNECSSIDQAKLLLEYEMTDCLILSFYAHDLSNAEEHIELLHRTYPELKIIVLSFYYIHEDTTLYRLAGAFAHYPIDYNVSSLVEVIGSSGHS